MTPRERLLLAVEAVPSAGLVINAGARLARRLQAEVMVLSVRERAYTRGVAWDVRPAGELAEVVSRAIYELQRLGIEARGIVGKARVGRVADEIVYAALKYQVEEIVIGSAGRTPVGSLLSSSVAPRVVRLSPVPVITVPTRRRRSVAGAGKASRHQAQRTA
jgi:nucleotide-binding universal stress UspA family protein